MRRRLPRLFLALALILAGAIWGGVKLRNAQRVRLALDQARRDITAGRFASAASAPAPVRCRGRARGEVDFQLGQCELRLGRHAFALAAWERVPLSSPFGAQAIARCALVLMESGWFSRSEELLEGALHETIGPDAGEVRDALQLVYHFQGRTDDLRRVIADAWTTTKTPASVLKKLYRLDTSPYPIEMVRQTIDKLSVDDDRLWLARTNLAIKAGQYEEAGRWLAACRKRRPTDLAVIRASLALALESENLQGVWEALAQMPASAISERARLRLRAWLTRHDADVQAEQVVLNELVREDPGDSSAWDRLAALAEQRGQAEDAGRLRRRKSEIDHAKERFRLLLRGDSFGNPAELAPLAERLGRRLEAHGWALIRDQKNLSATSPRAPLDSGVGGTPSGTGKAKPAADLFADLRTRDSRLVTRVPDHPSERIPQYMDEAEVAGLRFVHDNGSSPHHLLPETMSGGVGLLDYNGDGHLDVYVVQGGPFPPVDPPSGSGDRLFLNQGDGTFHDVTERSGLGKLAEVTATAWRWGISTTTASPTYLSRAGGRTPCTATAATGHGTT